MSEGNTGLTFTGTGRVIRTDTFTAKSGKDIVTLIVECDGGKFTEIVPIKVWGGLAEKAKRLKPGTVVAVSGRLGGRDWNGKVYGDIVAESVEEAEEPTGDVGHPPSSGGDGDALPF
jgi:hypothetical protein